MRRIFHGLLVGLLVGTLAYPAEAIQWGAGTGTSYPTTLDTANNRTNVGGAACSSAVTTNICKEWLNDWQGAVIAIMTEMGTLPKGSYADVKTRLNDAAYLSTANIFTANQTISNTAPSFTLTDTTASAKSLTIAVDANLAQFRESAGAAGSLLVLDLANNRVGIRRSPATSALEIQNDVNDSIGLFLAGYDFSGNKRIEIGAATTGQAGLYFAGNANFTVSFLSNILTYSTYDHHVFKTYNGTAYTEIMRITGNGAVGYVGIGTGSPDRLFHPELADAVTAATSYVQRISHITSGTAAVGFGAGLEWELENASGTNRVVGTLETVFTDATNATEDADFVVKLMAAGAAAAEKLRVDSTGLLITQNATLMKSAVTLTNGAGVGVGTLTNAPAAGNPTKWVAINDNGTVRYVPAW